MIEYYDFGIMKINGRTYTTDLIINRDIIIENWWRKEGHKIFLDDLKKYGVLNNDYDFVIIGTGYYGMVVVSNDVLNFFKNSKIIIEKTKNAVTKFNEIYRKNKNIAMFHLTC